MTNNRCEVAKPQCPIFTFVSRVEVVIIALTFWARETIDGRSSVLTRRGQTLLRSRQNEKGFPFGRRRFAICSLLDSRLILASLHIRLTFIFYFVIDDEINDVFTAQLKRTNHVIHAGFDHPAGNQRIICPGNDFDVGVEFLDRHQNK